MSHQQCGCAHDAPPDPKRRRVIQIAAAGVAAGLTGFSGSPLAAPTVGDRLVLDDEEAVPVPLRAADLEVGKPVVAFPFDAASKEVRNASRMHKIMLIKFAEADLDEASRERAAGGVLAFSAICTHQACEVKTWLPKEKVVVCFCHSSKFAPLEAGKVLNGPATRSLPTMPLKLEGDQLVIAGAFSARPGPSS